MVVNWYAIGDINTIAASNLPYYTATYIVENEQPIFYLSNTVGENGELIETRGIVKYKDENLVIPFSNTSTVYESHSGLYGLKVVDSILLLGIKAA